MNGDDLYRRYRRLIIKPSLRKANEMRGFISSLLFCSALAVCCLLCSLYFVLKEGAPWWISLIGILEGVVIWPLWWRWYHLLVDASRWPTRLLAGAVVSFVLVSVPHALEAFLIPQVGHTFQLDAGYFLALFTSTFLVLPFLIFLGWRKPDLKPPA